MSKLFNYRKEYSTGNLSRKGLPANPVKLFEKWFKEANDFGIPEPNAFILATTGKDMRPSSRILLLKSFDQLGFTFFTNYQSRKAHQLEENPYASLLFPWHNLERQVRIEGYVEKTTSIESDEYFLSRPEGSKLSAWASPQSNEIKGREQIDDRQIFYKDQFKDTSIPRPPYWGGYRLSPMLFEFWQGRENRLHDRIEYYLTKGNWKKRRLAP